VAEQRYQAVLAVIGEGGTVSEVAGRWGVSRQSVHSWLARYEAGGLEGLADRSHRPGSCPHQMEPAVEARVLELRRVHRSCRLDPCRVFLAHLHPGHSAPSWA
jgi:transposase-like protein